MTKTKNKRLSYCGEILRAQDPDRFLLSMFAPPQAREALWALFAFNLEIARTREVVTEMQLGLIRLQWWREAIGKIYEGGNGGDHEILRALAPAIARHGLPRQDFETLVYAREFDLENVLPGNAEGLAHYADFTTTPLLRLALRIAGDDPDVEPVQAVAVNAALTGLLRAASFHAAQGRCYLPEDLLSAQGVTLAEIYAGRCREKTRPPARAVMEMFVPGVRPRSRILRAQQALAGIYAAQIRRAGYDVFSLRLARPPAFKVLRVLAGARGGA